MNNAMEMNFSKASEEKLLVSEGGINVSISMIEPVLFLQGFGQKYTCEPSDIVLRGSLHLRVRTPAKIKAVSLAFHGKAVTKWPRGK
jgi:arrestin-related trafficking adapter 3/6